MAQLNSRGTLTRSRWDYFEHSNGIAWCYGQVPSGTIGAYFANNSTGGTAIDVYTINWSSSVSAVFGISLLQPPFVLSPLTPIQSYVFPLAADVATPPGVIGMFSAFTSPYRTFVRYSAGSTGAQMAPIMGSYFVTLPPGWGIAIGTPNFPSLVELSFSVWFQYVTDNVAPAM